MSPKMKSYESFDLWKADQSASHQRMIRVLRKLVGKTAPKLSETVKWGNACWVGKEYPVLYIYTDKDHLQLGFFGGKWLKDPKKLLRGNGQYVRHIRIEKPKDIDEKVFARYIREAAKNEWEAN